MSLLRTPTVWIWFLLTYVGLCINYAFKSSSGLQYGIIIYSKMPFRNAMIWLIPFKTGMTLCNIAQLKEITHWESVCITFILMAISVELNISTILKWIEVPRENHRWQQITLIDRIGFEVFTRYQVVHLSWVQNKQSWIIGALEWKIAF